LGPKFEVPDYVSEGRTFVVVRIDFVGNAYLFVGRVHRILEYMETVGKALYPPELEEVPYPGDGGLFFDFQR